ncbi:hypothetical protein LZ30DRAFT_587969 [Colletotrichum cereale]|nr:hypothetical protein LZ30DRAFT_587969 [Colletotrichum cereale]
MRSTLTALHLGVTSVITAEKTDETPKPQSTREFLTSHFLRLVLATSDEADTARKRDEDADDKSNAIWTTEVDEETIQLDNSTWRLAHVRSPFIHLNPQLTSTIASVCNAIRSTRGLNLGLSHLPRLRVEIKPETAAFTVADIRRNLLFLWSASRRLDTLHAEYCGPASAVAPGLELCRLFYPVGFVFPVSGGQGQPPTKLTHGPSDKVTMLDGTFSVRGAFREKMTIRAVQESDDMQWLAEGTNAHLWDNSWKEKIVPGAYDLTDLIGPHGGFIRFNQHAGTLDPEAIDNWVRVCCGIVDFCLNATKERLDCVNKRLALPSDLDPSVRASGSGPHSYTVYDLLVDLNLPSQAAYYRPLGPNPFVSELVTRQSLAPTVNIEETEGVSPYTFGIELEFLVPYSLVNTPDPHYDDPRWIYRHDPVSPADVKALYKTVYAANANYLASLLASAGHLSATFDTLIDDTDPNDAAIPASALETILEEAGDPPLYFVKGLDPRYQIWHVHRDSSLSRSHRVEAGHAGHLGVEISSPILRARPADFDKVFDVLKVLRGGARPMLDPSCGLHVHVGDIRGFSLRGLKKIATLVWAAELVLYSLVHPSREWNTMTVPISKGSTLACVEKLPEYTIDFDLQNPDTKGAQMEAMRLSAEIEAHVPMDNIPQRLRDEILQLWSVSSEYGLVRLLQPDSGCKSGVSFLSIQSSIDNQPGTEEPYYGGTVKFRLLEGTLDPELIAYWTKLVLRIVQRGTQTQPAEYYGMLEKILEEYYSKAARLEGFLSALGLRDHVPFWEKVAQRNRDLAEAEDGPDWQHPKDKELFFTDAEKEAPIHHWYEQNTTIVPAVDDETLERARGIL